MAVFVFRYFCFKCWIFRTSKKKTCDRDRLPPPSAGAKIPPSSVARCTSRRQHKMNQRINMIYDVCSWLCLLSLSIFTCMLDIIYDHIGTCGPCSWGWKAKVSSGKLCVDIAHIYTGYIDTVVLCICRVFLWANCVSIYIYTHVNHIIHCQCHQVVGLLPTASSCFDRCLRRSYGWHADLRYGGSTRRKDDRSTTCTTKSWIWKLKFWKQNGLFQNQIAECLGTLRLAGEFLWRCGGQWAQRRPLQGGAKVTLSIGHVFFWCFFPFFCLIICLYGSDTNSCGLVVRCWWRISCVQAPCQRCNWRNME